MSRTLIIAVLISSIIVQPLAFTADTEITARPPAPISEIDTGLVTLQPEGITVPLMGFIHIKNLPMMLEKQSRSRTAKLINDIISLVLDSGKDKPGFKEIFELFGGLKDIQDLKLPFNGQVFVPVYGKSPRVGIVADIDETAFPVFLDKLMALFKKIDAKVSLVKKAGGGEITIDQLKFVYRLDEGKFVAGADDESIQKLISVNKIFKTSAAYTRAIKNVGPDNDQVTFIDAVAVMELLEEKIPAETKTLMKKLGVLDIQSIIFTQKMNEQGVLSKSSIVFKESIKGLFSTVVPPNTGPTVHKYIPSSYNFLYRIKTAEFSRIWSASTGLLNQLNDEPARKSFQLFLSEFKKEFGFDLETDLIAALGGELAIALEIPELIGVPPTLLFIEIKDRAKIQKILKIIFEKAQLKPFTSTFEGHAVNTIIAPMVQPTYTFKDNYLVAAITPAGLREVLQLDPADSLVNRPQYKSVRALMPELGTSEQYLEMDKIIKLAIVGLYAWAGEAVKDPLVMKIIGTVQTAMAEPWPMISLMVSSPDSITSVSYEKHGSAAGLMGVAVMAAVMMPALLKSRGAAQRTACLANMKHIYAALTMYNIDHGRPAEKLSDLYPGYVAAMELLTCPEPGIMFSDKEEIDRNTMYLYRKVDLEKSPPDSLVLADIPGNHGRAGINFLLADGSAYWKALTEETIAHINGSFQRDYKLENISDRQKPALRARSLGFSAIFIGLASICISSMSPAAVVIGAGMLLPAIVRARGEARKVRCMSNIKQLTLAMLMYYDDNEKYPEKLSQLYPVYVASLDMFTCTASDDRAITDADRIDTETSYLYRKPQPNAAPTTPVICDKPHNHRMQGVNIGFMDGHAEWRELNPETKTLLKEYFNQ